MEELAARIRGQRIERAWSQFELAERAGFSRPTVARIERVDDVSTATLVKVAGALGLRVELSADR
ncbi:helix-turn-helix transcriptional regulator [Leucobacter sp. NPDC077196]|uniref:helix-turn-helix domain-containing protein n=1 Tax=Leucobacter sp. NPDC077196 TaxID=3154959 RepID=UPI003432A037